MTSGLSRGEIFQVLLFKGLLEGKLGIKRKILLAKTGDQPDSLCVHRGSHTCWPSVSGGFFDGKVAFQLGGGHTAVHMVTRELVNLPQAFAIKSLHTTGKGGARPVVPYSVAGVLAVVPRW